MKQKPFEEEENSESTCTVTASVKDVRGCLGTEIVVMATSRSSRCSVGVTLALFRLKKDGNILLVCFRRHKQTPAPKKGFHFHCLKIKGVSNCEKKMLN